MTDLVRGSKWVWSVNPQVVEAAEIVVEPFTHEGKDYVVVTQPGEVMPLRIEFAASLRKGWKLNEHEDPTNLKA